MMGRSSLVQPVRAITSAYMVELAKVRSDNLWRCWHYQPQTSECKVETKEVILLQEHCLKYSRIVIGG